MQELKRSREVMEECGKYYVRESDYTIRYEILISMTRISPLKTFGRWVYMCSLWVTAENMKVAHFPVFANSKEEARKKIARNLECYLKIGGAK